MFYTCAFNKQGIIPVRYIVFYDEEECDDTFKYVTFNWNLAQNIKMF